MPTRDEVPLVRHLAGGPVLSARGEFVDSQSNLASHPYTRRWPGAVVPSRDGLVFTMQL
jgi:hypothetical protein